MSRRAERIGCGGSVHRPAAALGRRGPAPAPPASRSPARRAGGRLRHLPHARRLVAAAQPAALRPPRHRASRCDAAHAQAACRDCHRSLVFSQVGTACADCHRGRARRRAGRALRRLPHAGVLDEPPGVLPRPQPHALPAAGRARAARLRVLPPRAAAAAVRGHAHRVRGLPPAGLPRDHRPRPRAPAPLARVQECHSVASSTWEGGAFGGSFPHPASFPLRGAHAGLTCARCHAGGFTGTQAQCVSCHRDDFDGRAIRPSRGRVLDPVPGVPQRPGLAAGDLRPRLSGFALTGRTRARAARAATRTGASRARPATAWPATATTTTAPRTRTTGARASRPAARRATPRTTGGPRRSTTSASSRSVRRPRRHRLRDLPRESRATSACSSA